MNYKLVMLDVDGTLINETKTISPRVRKAIEQAQRMGVIVTLCTGRLAVTCRDIVEELNLDSYGVYYSGALLKNVLRGNTLRKHTLPAHVAAELVLFARQHQLYLEVHTEEAYLYELEDAYSDFQAETLGVSPILTDLLEAVKTHEVLKLQFVTESEEAVRHINTFHLRNHHFELSPGKAPGYPMDFINAVPLGISKGTGIADIAQAMNIPLEQVIAVGDSLGDLEAIQTAGVGVAMGDANEALQAQAQYVAPPVWEDGVADVLEKFVLTPNA